ncbi:dihydrodiol dehydrogenase [Paenibacillus sp. EPM92]|uniref:dihydrodiol dehydrogenase n=1 Tax=Paenibacillus sp. EPM92 TaxID=1561195 RepID=UPI001915796C|nr:dihydrodiol dehydrogenase [Paenibacillus sp. EPM92]
MHEKLTQDLERDGVVIGSEFATVFVKKVYTRNGERLLISSPKLDKEILLDSIELESLTWQTTDTFSSFLEHPFGPKQV